MKFENVKEIRISTVNGLQVYSDEDYDIDKFLDSYYYICEFSKYASAIFLHSKYNKNKTIFNSNQIISIDIFYEKI